MTNYAPGSETELSRAVSIRTEIYNMLKLYPLHDLELIKANLQSLHTLQRPAQKSFEQIQTDWANRNLPFVRRDRL
jgi:hypothetical protein